MIAARMAGRLGWGGGLPRLFPPPCRGETTVLEEGKGEHRHRTRHATNWPNFCLSE